VAGLRRREGGRAPDCGGLAGVGRGSSLAETGRWRAGLIEGFPAVRGPASMSAGCHGRLVRPCSRHDGTAGQAGRGTRLSAQRHNR